jgi:lysophospholipase L1-like esterase
MKKLIYILLLLPFFAIGQISNGTEYTEEAFRATNNQTVTTSDFITTTGADGTQGKILGENISLSVIPPVHHFTPVTSNIKGYFQGVDDALGNVVATTAGITTRLWLTADQVTISAINFFKTNFVNKGIVASASQSVSNNDNEKKYFTQDIIGDPYVTITTFPKGVYAGNLSVSTSPNSAQQRFTVEVYKCNNSGTPIPSGVSGAVTGALGVTVITILDSGVLTLADGSVTNVPVSASIEFPFTVNVGERVRYHISAEKVGTTGANITESLYLGTSYNSYIDVPVPLNTTSVQDLSAVTNGGTTTDALNALNSGKANDVNVIHTTGDETKTGTLGVNGAIFNSNISAPSVVDGAYYKLTQPTTTGQSWSTTYYPLLSKYNGLLDYVKNRPATFRKKLMVIGSSVAYGVGATGNNGWANRLSADLIARGWTYKNHAIGGNTTTDVINRFYLDVVPENPDVLIIGLSLGNEGIMGAGKEAVYDSFKTSLQKLVLMCRQQGIIPVIANCYPRNEYTSVEYKYVQAMNKELDSWGVIVINLLGAVDDLTGKFVAGSVDIDGLHPNDVGHQEMYKTVPPSMFDCLVNWDEKRIQPEKGAVQIATDGTTEKPLEAIFNGGNLSAFTVAFWFKNNDINASGKVVAGLGSGTSRLTNSAGIGLRYITTTSTSVNFGVFPEVTKNWYHVALTYNAVTQKLRAYLNGTFVGEVTDAITLSRLAIGGRSDTGQASFNSTNTNFKDVAIYRSRMTDIQIKELYSGNIIKSSLEIFSPLSDKDVTAVRRALNFAPTLSYLKFNSGAFSSLDKGVINTDINANKIIADNVVVSTDQVSNLGSKLRVDGVVLPDGAVARGMYNSTTPTATANNDFLASMYIDSNFDYGAFTGVQSAGLRILKRGTLGNISLGSTSNSGQVSFARGSDGLTQAYVGYNTPTDASDFIISSASVSGTLSFFTNSIRQAQFYNDGKLTLQSGGPFVNDGINTLQVTGTASGTVDATLSNQFVRFGQLPTSGTYTPTLTNTTNISSSSVNTANYTKVGNIVTCMVAVSFNATAAGNGTLTVTLPIARTVSTNLYAGSGPGAGLNQSPDVVARLSANTTTITFDFTAIGTATSTVPVSFQYSIN